MLSGLANPAVATVNAPNKGGSFPESNIPGMLPACRTLYYERARWPQGRNAPVVILERHVGVKIGREQQDAHDRRS
jgi:hypothetical protein